MLQCSSHSCTRLASPCSAVQPAPSSHALWHHVSIGVPINSLHTKGRCATSRHRILSTQPTSTHLISSPISFHAGRTKPTHPLCTLAPPRSEQRETMQFRVPLSLSCRSRTNLTRQAPWSMTSCNALGVRYRYWIDVRLHFISGEHTSSWED